MATTGDCNLAIDTSVNDSRSSFISGCGGIP